MKILIADDSETYRVLISSILKKINHDVILVKNGEEAIQRFQTDQPDLVILDVMMDKLDGFETAKKIRELKTDSWIPIIFLSDSVDDQSIAKGIEAGGDDYLTKPSSEITLLAKIKAMQRIANMRNDLIEATQQLYILSSTDPLTKIANRLQFERRFNEMFISSLSHNKKIALFLIDLDNFKNINNTFGHHIGDLFLIEIAKRLSSILTAKDFIARLGGDEFAIILDEVKSDSDIDHLAKKIISLIGHEFSQENYMIKTTGSIGIAIHPFKNTTKNNFMLNADLAMYHVKKTGKNNYKIFSDEINHQYKQKISLEYGLKLALERKQLFLTYQPIFNLSNKNIFLFEIIVNWEHPLFGSISPSVFYPLAEEMGLIEKISNWTLETAVKQIAHLPSTLKTGFRFSINFFPRHLLKEDFINDLGKLLKKHNVSSGLFEFELKEKLIANYDVSDFNDVIDNLYKMNIPVLIDGFDIGYFSLFKLKKLPYAVKIHKSFIDNIKNKNTEIILKSLINLVKQLKMNAIAQGIANEEQLNLLKEFKVEFGQGDYLQKPINQQDLEIYLTEKIKKGQEIIT